MNNIPNSSEEEKYNRLKEFDNQFNAEEAKKKFKTAFEKEIRIDVKKTDIDLDEYEELIYLDEPALDAKLKELIFNLRNREKKHIHNILAKKRQTTQAPIQKANKTIEKQTTKVVLSEESSILFNPGSADLDKKSIKSLSVILKKLETQPNVSIRIEGYADATPVKKSGFKDNWDLSIAGQW